jgi:hypothetical protein
VEKAGFGNHCGCGPLGLHFRMVALFDLTADSLHQDDQALRFVVSFGLLAHLLEILWGIADTVRHGEMDPLLAGLLKEGTVYPIASLPA